MMLQTLDAVSEKSPKWGFCSLAMCTKLVGGEKYIKGERILVKFSLTLGI